MEEKSKKMLNVLLELHLFSTWSNTACRGKVEPCTKTAVSHIGCRSRNADGRIPSNNRFPILLRWVIVNFPESEVYEVSWNSGLYLPLARSLSESRKKRRHVKLRIKMYSHRMATAIALAYSNCTCADVLPAIDIMARNVSAIVTRAAVWKSVLSIRQLSLTLGLVERPKERNITWNIYSRPCITLAHFIFWKTRALTEHFSCVSLEESTFSLRGSSSLYDDTWVINTIYWRDKILYTA